MLSFLYAYTALVILSRPAWFLKITIVCNISMCVCAHARVYVYVASYAYRVLKRGAGLGYSIVFAV